MAMLLIINPESPQRHDERHLLRVYGSLASLASVRLMPFPWAVRGLQLVDLTGSRGGRGATERPNGGAEIN